MTENKIIEEMKKCTNCMEMLPLTYFYKNPKLMKNGGISYRSYCRGCQTTLRTDCNNRKRANGTYVSQYKPIAEELRKRKPNRPKTEKKEKKPKGERTPKSFLFDKQTHDVQEKLKYLIYKNIPPMTIFKLIKVLKYRQIHYLTKLQDKLPTWNPDDEPPTGLNLLLEENGVIIV